MGAGDVDREGGTEREVSRGRSSEREAEAGCSPGRYRPQPVRRLACIAAAIRSDLLAAQPRLPSGTPMGVDVLMGRLAKRIADRRRLGLIRRYLGDTARRFTLAAASERAPRRSLRRARRMAPSSLAQPVHDESPRTADGGGETRAARSTSPFPSATSRQPRTAEACCNLNSLNRRMRTRTSGDVGRAARGFPGRPYPSRASKSHARGKSQLCSSFDGSLEVAWLAVLWSRRGWSHARDVVLQR